MKSVRHDLILDIIDKKDIETQEELAAELKARGVKVTQATVSRDIKELRPVSYTHLCVLWRQQAASLTFRPEDGMRVTARGAASVSYTHLGDVRAMVTEREEKIVGVVIVAEGAGDIGVRLSLMQAARALLEIDLEQIEVIEMRREGNARSMVVDGLYFCPAGGGDGAGVLKAPGAAAERAGGGLRFL